jgi:hypothetical protein
VFEKLTKAVEKRQQLLNGIESIPGDLTVHELNSSIALHMERISFMAIAHQEPEVFSIKSAAENLVKSVCPQTSDAIVKLNDSVIATSSGQISYDTSERDNTITIRVAQDVYQEYGRSPDIVNHLTDILDQGTDLLLLSHQDPNLSSSLPTSKDETNQDPLLLGPPPPSPLLLGPPPSDPLLLGPPPTPLAPTIKTGVTPQDLQVPLITDGTTQGVDPSLPASNQGSDNPVDPLSSIIQEQARKDEELRKSQEANQELARKLDEALQRMDDIKKQSDLLQDGDTQEIERLQKTTNILRTTIQGLLRQISDQKNPKKLEMVVPYKWDGTTACDIHIAPDDDCTQFLYWVLDSWIHRTFRHKIKFHILLPYAKELWTAARLDTFQALLRATEKLDGIVWKPYQDGPEHLFLRQHTFNHLLANVRATNTNEEKASTGSINPMSDDLLREAWTAGMIAWLPAIVGTKYRHVYDSTVSANAPFQHNHVDVRVFMRLLDVDDSLYRSTAGKYRGIILNKAQILDLAKKIDAKEELSENDTYMLSWYLKSRISEATSNYKDVRFNHAIVEGELCRVHRVTKEIRKEPPEQQAPVPSNEKSSLPIIEENIPPPTGSDELPEIVPSKPVTDNSDNVDKRITEADAEYEKEFLANPVPWGHRAPELRWPSLAPPDGATHFSGRYKPVPRYDESGRYIGCVHVWASYPSPLEWAQLPMNAQQDFKRGGPHWANRVFYSEGRRFRFNSKGTWYDEEKEPTRPIPKEEANPGLKPTPWSEKARDGDRTYPLQYTPAPAPLPSLISQRERERMHERDTLFQVDESTIKREGSYQQDTHIHSGSSPTQRSEAAKDFQPFITIRDEDEYRDRDHFLLQKDIRGYTYSSISPLQEYNLNMRKTQEVQSQLYGSPTDHPIRDQRTPGSIPSRRHFPSSHHREDSPRNDGNPLPEYGGLLPSGKTPHTPSGPYGGPPGTGGIPSPTGHRGPDEGPPDGGGGGIPHGGDGSGGMPPGGSGGGGIPPGGGGGAPPPGGPSPTSIAAPGGISVKPLMKPDVKAYPVLKVIADYSKWYADSYALARAQGIEIIFDHTYAPAGDVDRHLFHYIQAFVYAVLRRTIKPPELWQYIEFYSTKSDAQACLIAITNHVRKSTYAIITLRDNMQAIVNARMVKDWKGSALEFILAFDTMMDEYNKSQPSRELQINPHQKRQYLQNAVAGVKGLQDVLDRESDRITMGERPFTYEQYLATLKSVSTRLDDKRSKEGRRFANWHDVGFEDGSPGLEANVTETERMEYLINEAKRFKDASDYAAQMNRDTWKSLKPETQEAWDKFPKEEKIKLLTYSKDRHDRRNAKANLSDTSPSMEINNHDVKEQESADETPSKDNDIEETGGMKVNTSMWKIQSAEQKARSEAHPGDIRRMMGTPSPARASIEAKLHQYLTASLNDDDSDSSEGEGSPDFQ